MKKKKIKKTRKYKPGGANFGQMEYGANTLTSSAISDNQKTYIDSSTSAYQAGMDNLNNMRDQYLEELGIANKQENAQNIQQGTSKLINNFTKAEGTTFGDKAKNLFAPTNYGMMPANASNTTVAFNNAVAGSNTLTGTASVGSAITPYALPAYLAGKGIGYLADDEDETTWTGGEITGDLLASTGSGVGTGAMIGSALGPAGAGVGAVVGGIYGLGKGIYKGVTGRNEAREEEEIFAQEKINKKNKFRQDMSSFYQTTGDSSSNYGNVYQGRHGGIKPMNSQGDMIVYGPTHEQGGVMRDSNTELEGGGMKNGTAMPGEVITNVQDSQGNTREYYFSDHLKNPSTGNTFAEDYRKSGGMNMNSKQTFAKLQEKVAGRNDKSRSPQTIAKNGGYRTYQDGSFNAPMLKKGAQKTGEFLLKKAPGLMGTFGKYSAGVTAPAMLYDFYNRGQEMSGGKVMPNMTEEQMNASNPSMGGKSIAEVNAGIPKFKGFSFRDGGPKDATYFGGTLPEVTIEDRRVRSGFEKSLASLQKEIDFLQDGVLSKTPLGGETPGETAMNIASLSPLGMSRLGVLKGTKYLKNLAKKTPSSVKGLFRKKKPFPQGTMDVPLPGGGTIKQPSLLPAVIKKKTTIKEATRNIIDKARQNISPYKKQIVGGLVTSGVLAPILNNAYDDYTEDNTIKTNLDVARQAIDLKNSQESQNLIRMMRDGKISPDDLQGIDSSRVSTEVFDVADSLRNTYNEGGLQKPSAPRSYKFGQDMPNQFDRSLEANRYRQSYNSYLKELEVYNQAMSTDSLKAQADSLPTVNPIQPTFQILNEDQAQSLQQAKAFTPEQIAGMSDEELDAYLNATSLDPQNVNIGEVVVQDDSAETQAKKAREAYQAGEAARMQEIQGRALPNIDEYSSFPVGNMSGIFDLGPYNNELVDIGEGENASDEFDTKGVLENNRLMAIDQSQNNAISKVDSRLPNLIDSKQGNFKMNMVSEEGFNESIALDKTGPYPETEKSETITEEGGEGFDLKALLDKVGLGDLKATDAIGTAAAGLGLYKTNKIAKEIGDLELDVKADIKGEKVPKQKISMEAERKQLNENATALLKEMARQGKSSTELLAVQSETQSQMEKLNQTEKNLQSEVDLKVDAMNSQMDMKEKLANKEVELSKAMADLDISAAEKQNRIKIWQGITNQISGMALDAKKMQSVETQLEVISESMAKSEAMSTTLTEALNKILNKE